jgi:uncharacterized membrane protein YecN with MAPEG domain
LSIVPFYAAVLTLFFVGLSVRTLRMRRRLNIAIGDAGDKELLRAMRVHANFAEYVPLSLLLFLMMELAGAHPMLLHVLAILLVLGRLSHAYGVSQVRERYAFRVFGMAMTFATLLLSSAWLLHSSIVTANS